MRIKQRITSMLLCIITLFSLMPLEAFANNGLWKAGVSTGGSTSGGDGNWLTKQQGYRISVIDPKTVTTVTDKIDFVFGNTPERAVYCSNNKIEGFTADNTKYEAQGLHNLQILSVNEQALIDALKDVGSKTDWPKHTLWSNGAQSNDEFDDWFLKGQLSGKSGSSKPPASYTGGGSNRRPSSGSASSGKPSTPGDSTVTGRPGSVDSKSSEIRNSMQREFDLLFKAGKSRGVAAAAAERVGYSIVCDLELSDSFTPAELQRLNAEVKRYANHLAAPDSAAGSASISPLSPAYGKIKEYSDGSSIFDIAYASQDPAFDSTKTGAAYAIMDLKNDHGNFVFAFNNGETAHLNEKGELTIIQTICDNGYYILVEPLYWFIPEKWRESTPHHYDAYMGGNTFYGTPTNYGQFAKEASEASKPWTDRSGNRDYRDGTGGNYGSLVNRVGPHTLHLGPDETLYKQDSSGNPIKTEDGVIIYGESTTNTTLKNSVIGNNKRGYAVHYYWGKGGGGFDLPKTQTYDPFEKDPNPDPHKAPNPDPNYVAPNGKTPVPLVKGEPTEDWTDDWKGYKQITRTVNIVKCYDIEHLDGTIEHVKTEGRRWNPGTIDVQQEPDYKVIGYYTSPYYIGYDIFNGTMIDQEMHSRMPFQYLLDETESGDWDDTDKSTWVTTEYETTWQGMRDRMLEISPEYGVTKKFDYDNKIAFDKNAKAGKSVGSVVIGVAADLEFDDEKDWLANGKRPNEGYDDTTLYVHLIKKEEIPETSTWDGDPPGETPPPDPFKDPQTDPETTPKLTPDNPLLRHEIVKVYQVKDWSDWKEGMPEPEWKHKVTFYRYPTAPIVTVENEDDYELTEWKVAVGVPNPDDKTTQITTPPVTSGTDWEDPPISTVSPFKSGVQPAKVDIRDPNDNKNNTTIYVLLRREIPPEAEDLGDGAIIIQQSQITKAVRTNDKLIANKASANWGNYSFHYEIGDFASPPHSFSHSHGKYDPPHYCYHTPNDRWVDNDLCLWFHQLTAKQNIQVPDGKFTKTDNAVYSGNSNKGITHQRDEKITKLSGMNQYDYTSDGKGAKGEELVTVLWRQGVNDKPILASYKQRDITNGNGYILNGVSATNWTDSLAIVDKADRKAGNGRSLDNGFIIETLQFTFGIKSGEGDHSGTSECTGCTCHGCHAPIQNTKQLSVRSGNWAEDFMAPVCVRVYKGREKDIAAQPYGVGASPQTNIKLNDRMSISIIQGKQQIKFFPYIRMTYMVNSLADATGEAQNTDNTGYVSDVRKDTYVISEYESKILPNDAVVVYWENNKKEETLRLTSQQWSLHQRAINGSDGWQGRNQVLPGGAIFQLSTPEDSRTTVNLITYQTVVDEKARAEYLTSTSTLSGDEYTTKKVVADHLAFVNDAKEVLDNLKIVQWVHNPGNSGGNKFSGSEKAYPANFDETKSGYICLYHNGKPRDDSKTKLSQLDSKLTRTPSTDGKYYMHAADMVTDNKGVISKTGKLAEYQNSTKLSDITITLLKAASETDRNNQVKPNQGDLDISKIYQKTTVYKVFTDTNGNIYMISDYREGPSHIDQVEADINTMISSMKDINADTYDKWSAGGSKKKVLLVDKKVPAADVNKKLTDTDAKRIDDRTKFITNIVASITRNKGVDKTAEWVQISDPSIGRWYNEAFDGIYLVEQHTKIEIGLIHTDLRTSVLDPALCPQNLGQSDLYSNAYLSQFTVDSHSDAKIAEGKPEHYLGTFKGMDITLLDMERMYESKRFFIPNANVQDLY